MLVEIALINGEIIGWRVQAGGSTCLIWHNQKSMPGIRVGEKFSSAPDEKVDYEMVYSFPL